MTEQVLESCKFLRATETGEGCSRRQVEALLAHAHSLGGRGDLLPKGYKKLWNCVEKVCLWCPSVCVVMVGVCVLCLWFCYVGCVVRGGSVCWCDLLVVVVFFMCYLYSFVLFLVEISEKRFLKKCFGCTDPVFCFVQCSQW